MNTQTQQRSIISDKKYQCLVCKNTETHATNHYGEIYCSCRNCGHNGLACIEPEAIEARKNLPVIITKLNKYRFDISNAEGKKQYETLKKQLKSKGLKLFDCISTNKHGYFGRLPNQIEIEISYVFDNQWNSSAGRVFDWYEEIYPNKKIKEGYWLELTEEHTKARAPKEYVCKTFYKDALLGGDIIHAINEGEASNQLFSKYFVEGMDIWEYKTSINKNKTEAPE